MEIKCKFILRNLRGVSFICFIYDILDKIGVITLIID